MMLMGWDRDSGRPRDMEERMEGVSPRGRTEYPPQNSCSGNISSWKRVTMPKFEPPPRRAQ